MEDYIEKFKALSALIPNQSEEQALDMFLHGLQPDVKNWLQFLCPETCDRAMDLARHVATTLSFSTDRLGQKAKMTGSNGNWGSDFNNSWKPSQMVMTQPTDKPITPSIAQNLPRFQSEQTSIKTLGTYIPDLSLKHSSGLLSDRSHPQYAMMSFHRLKEEIVKLVQPLNPTPSFIQLPLVDADKVSNSKPYSSYLVTTLTAKFDSVLQMYHHYLISTGSCLTSDSKGELIVPSMSLLSIDSSNYFDKPRCMMKLPSSNSIGTLVTISEVKSTSGEGIPSVLDNSK